MDRYEVVAQLEELIGEYLLDQGLVLVELIYRHEGRDLFLRVLADWPRGGITVGECSRLNRELGAMLEEKNILQDRSIMEVSSPGLDRPLKNEFDFTRCLNRRARFFLNAAIKDRIEWVGVITEVKNNVVFVAIDNAMLEIPLSSINKAQQIIP